MPIVVFEGIDGSGKTTQITLLNSELSFFAFSFPTKEGFGRIVREYLQGNAKVAEKVRPLIFLSDILSYEEEMAKASEEGLVLVDRYIYSTIAYEVNSPIGWRNVMRIVESLSPLKPDLVIYFDLPVDLALKRKKRKDIYEENRHFLSKVNEVYDFLYKEKFYSKKWVRIDASRRVEEIFEEVKEQITSL